MQRKEIIIWRPTGSSFDSGGLEISSDGLETKCNVTKYSFGDPPVSSFDSGGL